MAENTRSVLERTAADQWKVLPSGLTVLVRPMPGYSGTHVIYATRFGSIDRDFRLGEREVHLPAGVAHFLEHKMFEEVRHARRGVVSFALERKGGIHRAEIGREDGKGFAEALLGQIAHAQAVFQCAHLHALAQGGIVLDHCAAPFIK